MASAPPPVDVHPPARHAADGGPPLADRLGLPGTIALVVGGIVGTGIFAIPAAVAPYGWLSVPAFVVVGLGSFALALCFADLARRTRASGGPYRHAQDAFGAFAGFLGAWTYWIQGWAGHATIAVAAAGYLQALTGADDGRGSTLLLALGVLVVPLLLNLSGTRSVGVVAVVTTTLKIGALVLIAIVGLTAFDPGNVGAVRPHDGDALAALPAACAVLLFAFLGMEGATVVIDRVRDPHRDVPRAVIGGVATVGLLYLVATLAVQGAVPQEALTHSSAPFADATQAVLGGSWPARFVAGVAVVSALGALTGFNMVNAEMVVGAARDRLFPVALAHRGWGGAWSRGAAPSSPGSGPPQGAADPGGPAEVHGVPSGAHRAAVPARALLLNATLAAVLLIVNATGDALSVFTTLALLSTFVYVFGYVLAVSAQLLHALGAGDRGEAPSRLQVGVAVVAVAFSIWMASATGPDAVRSGTVLILVGIPVFALSRARRGDVAERPPAA